MKRICKDVADGPDCYFRRYPRSVHKELKLALEDIKYYYDGKTRVGDDYWQLMRDQWMADNGYWENWTGKKIVIAHDKNKALLHWFFAEAVQSWCPAGKLTRMDDAIKAYAWLNPVLKAGKRFDVNKDYHLLNNPHDFKRLEEMNATDLAVHQAVCGAEHMVAHQERGNTQHILRQEMHMKKKFDNLAGEEYGWTQFEKPQYGAMGIGTKISRLFLDLLDPTLFGHYISCTEDISKQRKVDAVRGANGKDCFSYRALNFNTHTEDHLDSGDHKRGVGGLQISGDFTVGDFILRDTKQMFESPPGSQGFVRGPVQRHCTRAWSGNSRFYQVMIVKHSVWLRHPPTGLQEEPEPDEKGPKKRKRGPEYETDPGPHGKAGPSRSQPEEERPTKRRTKKMKEPQADAGVGSTSKSTVSSGCNPKVKGTSRGSKKGSSGR